MKKTGHIARTGLLALAAGGLLIGCAATAHRESTGEVIDDSAITSRVKAALVADPQTKAREISVKTYRGVVQLSGFVDSGAERRETVRVARQESGVRSVDDELHINGGSRTVGRAFDDADITARVKAALIANHDTKAHQINVTTSHGVVELSGFVDSNDERDEAGQVAQSISGVQRVDNDLQLQPPPPQ